MIENLERFIKFNIEVNNKIFEKKFPNEYIYYVKLFNTYFVIIVKPQKYILTYEDIELGRELRLFVEENFQLNKNETVVIVFFTGSVSKDPRTTDIIDTEEKLKRIHIIEINK